MKACLALILALVASPAVALVDADADAKNPVSKVTKLLKDMIEQMEKEGEEDEDTYQAMGCWCETNDKEKTKAIADAEQAIERLTAAVEEFTGNSARLNTEIANLEKEVAKNSDALDKATALRKKELAEFNAEEKDLLGTAASLKSAVVVLSKHHSASSFIQMEASASATVEHLKVITSLKHIVQQKTDMVKELFTPHQRKKLTSFVQNTHRSGATAPASGEIFGMLQAMKESVEINLANAQKDEAESQADFESLKAAKEEEIAAGTELAETKTQELASTDEKNAQSKEKIEDTTNQLAADTKFLANLKEQCSMMDQEYEERTKARQGEIEACSKALAFLSSDDAHALFSKSLGGSAFIQVASKSTADRRAKVSKFLKQAAQKYRDPRVSFLAIRAKMDAFAEVKKSISDMIEALKKEQKDEIKHKDFCIKELNANERDTEMKERDRADLEAKIDDLTMTVDALTKEIDALKATIAELSTNLKRAGEDREKQNAEFQTVVADQRATQKLLDAALGILKGFYEKAALVQERQYDIQPAFKKHEKNENSGGVMGMIQELIDEAKGLEADAIRAEEESQKAYEEFVKDTNDSTEEASKSLVSKSDMKAKSEQEKVEAETEHEATMGALEDLSASNADLHKSCDFTIKNFETRQAARGDEIEALKQAMAMFSGASFAAFLQK